MRNRLHSILLAAVSCAVLAGYQGWSMRPTTSWGWDETMHAVLPATRMSFAIEEGLPRRATFALLACERYPFAFPVVLACQQLVFGASEHGARLLVTALWGLTLLGVFLLGRRVASAVGALGAAGERDPPTEAVGWLALGFAALCPLALGFAGTVFLEVPFACAMVFGLLAWVRRSDDESGETSRASERRRDLVAGAAIALCFFTKFNYGLLFAAGVGLDWLLQGIAARGRGELAAFWRRSAWLAVVPLLAFLWWFVLPLPGGLALGESHRNAFWLWIRGNQERRFSPWKVRFFHLLTYLAPTTRLALVEWAGVLLALRFIVRARVRALVCVFGVMGGVILVHTMHLDRFWIPSFVAVWVLAAVGLVSVLPRAPVRRGIALALLGLLTLVFPRSDLPIVAHHLAIVVRDADDPDGQERRLAGLRDRLRLDGGRRIPSTGALVEENQALLDLVASGVRPGDRVGSIGITDWVSTSALHFGLWERGGPRLRYIEQAARVVDLTLGSQDPGFSDARLERFAAPFDVLLGCDPSPNRRARNRPFLAKYRARLVELGWQEEVLGSFAVAGEAVRVYALRKPPGSGD